MSPLGWWMPTAELGVDPLTSQPAYSTLKLDGGVLLNSIRATSLDPLLTSSVPPETLWLVGPVFPDRRCCSRG